MRLPTIWLTLTCAVLSAGVVSGAAAPATRPATTRPTTRRAVPEPAAVAEAEALVRGVFKQAFAAPPAGAAQPPQRKAEFAHRFFAQAILAGEGTVDQYVLLRMARDFAAAGGDSVTALRAIARLERLFGVGPLETREAALAALTTPAAVATSPAAAEYNGRALLQLVGGATAVGDFVLAARAAAAIKPPVAKAPEWEGLDQEASAAAAAMETLRSVPDDPKSNRVAGSHLCFSRGDWDAGLPLLARGADADLKALAARDAAATDAPARAEAADAWWDAAAGRDGRTQQAMRLRAGRLYVQALPELPALRREYAEKRLRELRHSTLRPGLIADLYEGPEFNRRRGVRVDARIDFHWGEGPPDATLPPDRFTICWQGHIKAPRPGRYVLQALADDGVIVRLDGREVISWWKAAAGPPHSASVELTGEPQTFEVLYQEQGGGAAMRVSWKPPGEAKAVPVPPEAFWHDPEWPWGRTAFESAARPADATACSSGDGETVWLKKFQDALPWHTARRRCEQMGGRLATIASPEQADCLARMADKPAVWLGGSDEESEGRWEWTGGERIDPDLYNWAEAEPNGVRKENYLMLAQDRGWNDVASRQAFICQWER